MPRKENSCLLRNLIASILPFQEKTGTIVTSFNGVLSKKNLTCVTSIICKV